MTYTLIIEHRTDMPESRYEEIEWREVIQRIRAIYPDTFECVHIYPTELERRYAPLTAA